MGNGKIFNVKRRILCYNFEYEGTADEVYSQCKMYCEEHDIKPLYVEGANHSLEVEEKLFESLEILKEVMKYIER